ncbi:tRNA cyclic N6-threonylcarbamoyladenosine(37) synthase TcdA, partial [Acinetobacter baumannii]|nr:tRNA cyclic N6-threonylcarbamoyladenosine(37) synthase TcdA [Acinetobacter baumannii]
MNQINTQLFSATLEEEVDFARRFGGIARLYGERALERFRAAHV